MITLYSTRGATSLPQLFPHHLPKSHYVVDNYWYNNTIKEITRVATKLAILKGEEVKRNIVWLLVSGLMVAVLLVTSCGPAVTKEKEVVTEEETPTFEVPLSLGETAQAFGVAVTVSNAMITDSYEYYDKVTGEMRPKEASSGWTFLIANIKIEVVGEARVRKAASNLYLSDSDGSIYKLGVYYGEGAFPYLSNRNLAQGDELSGKALFNVKKGSTGLKIGYLFKRSPVETAAEWEIK